MSDIFVCKQSFKTDCCLTNSDAHVIGGSEDGLVFFWDLVDAKIVSKFRAHDLVVMIHFFVLFTRCKLL